MTRKDTILIAVVINAGLLAVLFTTAVIYDTDPLNDQAELAALVTESKPVAPVEPPPALIAATTADDEVDNVLKFYTEQQSKPIVLPIQPEVYVHQSAPIKEGASPKVVESSHTSSSEYIDVVVKRGDVLERIAKANKTTVETIKKINQLPNENLSIGQVLKVPAKQSIATNAISMIEEPRTEVKSEPKREVKKDVKGTEPVYYTVESGDNPWKIARKFGVKYEEILKLNQLDEDKARNLKIGDRIRVK